MAVKWSAFTSGTTITGTDITVGLQGGANVQWTMAQLKTWTSASPSLVTPDLGTPSAGVLTSCTGLPISTGVSGLGTGIATFLATPSSANLASAVTDETGTGALVFANTPALVTPAIGAATGTSLTTSGTLYAYSATAIPAGGTAGSGLKLSSTSNFGMFFGSGAPTLSAAQGAIYLRSDGTAATGIYTNTNGSTTWSAISGVPSVIQKQVFTGSGTFTSPAGTLSTTVFKVTVTGAGGGGDGGQTNNVTGAAGGGGGTAIKWYTGLSASTGYTVTVGAGGAAGSAGGGGSGVGGNSSFAGPGTTITGNGGGAGSTAGVNGGDGGTGSNGDINCSGSKGEPDRNGTVPYSPGGTGGGSTWGPGGPGGCAATAAASGTAGTAYGAGGGGGNATVTNQGAAGAGAGGIVVVEWIL